MRKVNFSEKDSHLTNGCSFPKSKLSTGENVDSEIGFDAANHEQRIKCLHDLNTMTGKALKIAYRSEYKTWSNCKHRSAHLSGVTGPVWDAALNTFPGFLNCVGPKPKLDYSLDRIDPDFGYVQGNLRWASKQLQSENRGIVEVIDVEGEPMLRRELAERLGISRSALRMRLKRGIVIEELQQVQSPSQKDSAIARQVEASPWPDGKEDHWEACYQAEHHRLLQGADRKSKTAFLLAKCETQMSALLELGRDHADKHGYDDPMPKEFDLRIQYWKQLRHFARSQRQIVEQGLGPLLYDVAPTDDELDELDEFLHSDSMTDEDIGRAD